MLRLDRRVPGRKSQARHRAPEDPPHKQTAPGNPADLPAYEPGEAGGSPGPSHVYAWFRGRTVAMPPRDPRLCPALEVAVPADSATTTAYRSDRSPWLMMFGDGQEHPVTVIGWWTDRHGRSVVQVEWHAESSTWEGSFMVDAARLREG